MNPGSTTDSIARSQQPVTPSPESAGGIRGSGAGRGEDANFKRAFALLQAQRDELREMFKYIFSEYLKWYTWYIGFNLTALGATTIFSVAKGWNVLAIAFCIADLSAVGTCVYMLLMSRQMFDALTTYSKSLIALCSDAKDVPFPDFSNERPIRQVAAWSLPANALGLLLLGFYWGFVAFK